jgi:serine/threonine protein phosphatase PrpC
MLTDITKHSLSAGEKTAPLPNSASGFQPLPEGAVVGHGAFYITQRRHGGPDYSIYGVEEAIPVFPCPNPQCGHLENLTGDSTCASCDTSLEGVIPVHRRYQIFEYREFEPVKVAASMTERGLKHPGLLHHRFFSERPYGDQDRYYLLLPDPVPPLATQVPVPQKTVRVLKWGAQLADALAYLHKNHIGWLDLSPDHIALQERKAAWVDFIAAQHLSQEKAEAIQQRERDVAGLTSIIFYLATGEKTFTPQTDFPPSVTSVFERVLNAQAKDFSAHSLAEALRSAVDAVRRPTSVCIRVGRCTDVGLVRDLNEDSLLALELDRVCRSVSRPVGLFAVADGMGGHAAGDLASSVAIDTMARKMAAEVLAPLVSSSTTTENLDAPGWLAEAIQEANQAVHMHRQSTRSNMGTTLVAALLIGDTAYIANVGDSRAYLINSKGIERITTDHSLVERMVALGEIGPAEARIHPQRNVIYRSIGDREEAEVDYFAQKMNPGDSLLLCSDGLTGKMEDTEIRQLVQHNEDPQEACEQLVQAANNHGGQDNVTAIIIQARNDSPSR